MRKQHLRPIDRRAAMLAASEFMLFHYPAMFTAARPQRLTLKTMKLWIVPVVLTHPTAGAIGQVGSVAIEANTGKMLGSVFSVHAVLGIGTSKHFVTVHDPLRGKRRISRGKFERARRYLANYGVACGPRETAGG